MQIFNKTFFRFLSGFFGLILVGLFFVFAAGYYESEIIGKGKNLETASPRGGAAVSFSDRGKQNTSLEVNPRFIRPVDWMPEYPPRPE